MYLPISYIRADPNFLESKFYIMGGKFIMTNPQGTVFAVNWDNDAQEEDNKLFLSTTEENPFVRIDSFLKKSGGVAFSKHVPPIFETTPTCLKLKIKEDVIYYKFPIKNSIPDNDKLAALNGVCSILDNSPSDITPINIMLPMGCERHLNVFDKGETSHVRLKFEKTVLIIEDDNFEIIIGKVEDKDIDLLNPPESWVVTLLTKNIIYFLQFILDRENHITHLRIQLLDPNDPCAPIILYPESKRRPPGGYEIKTIKALAIAPYDANEVENGIAEPSGVDIPSSGGAELPLRLESVTIGSADTGVLPLVSSSVIDTGVDDSINSGDGVIVRTPIFTGSPPDGVKVSFDEESGIVIWEPGGGDEVSDLDEETG